jgi:hypothetical protein
MDIVLFSAGYKTPPVYTHFHTIMLFRAFLRESLILFASLSEFVCSILTSSMRYVVAAANIPIRAITISISTRVNHFCINVIEK